jgi:Fic family protein
MFMVSDMANYNWISFMLNLARLPWQTWVKLGECAAKCEQLKNIPLTPGVRDRLHVIYLAKGIHATTAIEGNTLSEEQVRELIDEGLELPVSKEYLKQEVSNVLEACNEIADATRKGYVWEMSVEQLCHYNSMVLGNDVPRDEAAVPGEIRSHNVVVGSVYRAPSAEDVAGLTRKLCDWMNSGDFSNAELLIHFGIIKAIAAHLYVAWIHPFGDGNGRVARLVEFAILLNCGIPSPAVHLFSNHYNTTRGNYYRQLNRASKTGDAKGFLSYAIDGFLDGLDEQLRYVQEHVIDVCWRDYVYEQFQEIAHKVTSRRRRSLALSISMASRPLDKESLLLMLGKEYKGKTEKTLVRDLRLLEQMRLICNERGQYRANRELMFEFMVSGRRA